MNQAGLVNGLFRGIIVLEKKSFFVFLFILISQASL